MNALSEIETNVLRMLAGGMTPAEIAFALDEPKERIEELIADVIDKFKTPDTTAAVTAAIKTGLIQIKL